MGILKRDEILSAVDLKTETVNVPEWGGSVCVRGMTGAERDAFEAQVYGDTGGPAASFRACLLARSIVDEAGERLFTEKDIEALGQKSGAALSRLLPVAMKLSGLRKVDELDAEKN